MAATPKKGVHWNFDDISFSELNSPSGSSDSYVSTSSLEYANSQLVAHGFVQAPGLCLDGISNKESEKVVKCLLNLLGQRVEDMSRTEELTTKYRTLTYDHERLGSMHRLAVEKAANAEREASLHKSKLTATTRTLQSSENAHKQTTAELQRTRTSLQAIRSTHQAELKKREKEIERLTEKWQKIADLQSKMTNSPSGIQCANIAAVEGRNGLDRGSSYLDVALEEAEKARAALLEDNNYLKALLLKAVNSIQRILYQTNGLLAKNIEELSPFTVSTLFPIAPPSHPADKLASLLTGLRNSLETVSERLVNPIPAAQAPDPKEVQSAKAMNGEITRLQTIIESLQNELDRCHKQLEKQAQEIQAMFESFAQQQSESAKGAREMSLELMSAPIRDEEKARLEQIRQDLDQERQKFTDATITFGKEKTALETERLKFLDEKRSWEMEKMLETLPPTPIPPPSPVRLPKVHKQSPRKLGTKSPKKSSPKKISSKTKTTRASHISLGSPKKVIPAGETEILPPITTLTFSTLGTMPPPLSLLSTAFVLPPPSPHSSFPSNPALPPPAPVSPPEPGNTNAKTSSELQPTTPPAARKPFPVAKPFAMRMVHAYSPAKPSPLSRILMLADTPNGGAPNPSPNSSDEFSPILTPHHTAPEQPAMSLAAELGVSESPPDTPLQEKKPAPNVVLGRAAPAAVRGRVLFPEPKKPTSARDKGKMKANSAATTSTRPSRITAASKEKENSDDTAKGGFKAKQSPVFKPPVPHVTKKGPSPTSTTAAASGRPPSAAGVTTKPLTAAKPVKPVTSRPPSTSAKPVPAAAKAGGPRRVPIDSAEALPLVKSRRG